MFHSPPVMPVLLLLLGLGFLALVLGPRWWVSRVMTRNAAERPDFPGTGGELARHLLDEAGLASVGVEETDEGGDHYDPDAKTVRLSPSHLNRRSLTAVTVAAHEVGHALQDRDHDPRLRARQATVRGARVVQRAGIAAMTVLPLVTAFAVSPRLALLTVVASFLVMAVRVLADLVTLPVEHDASFNRALPLLERGGYLLADDMPEARRLLRACALTYVAASAVSLIDFARWFRILRGA